MAKTNILVVEDESIVSKDIQHSLKKLGYNVVGSSSTGEKAIDLAMELKPDLVLMDIMLKGKLTGIDAAECERSNEGVIHDLECQHAERLGVRGGTCCLLFRLGVDALDRRNVQRRRQEVNHSITKRLTDLDFER